MRADRKEMALGRVCSQFGGIRWTGRVECIDGSGLGDLIASRWLLASSAGFPGGLLGAEKFGSAACLARLLGGRMVARSRLLYVPVSRQPFLMMVLCFR